MSIVRNSAHRLADFVVRYASPGSKEWAEAMASELAEIENDWHALAWATGGLRVLFYVRPKPLDTLQELNAMAQSYADRRRLQVNDVWLARNVVWLTMLLFALSSLSNVCHGKDRLGNALNVLGFLTLSLIQYYRSREPDVPDRDDPSGLVRFYRENLVRSTNVFSLTFWLFPAAVVLITTGYELTVTYSWERALGVMWFGILMLFFSGQRSNRRRLAQIDALLAANAER